MFLNSYYFKKFHTRNKKLATILKKSNQLGYFFEKNFTPILNMHIFLRPELPLVFYRDFEFFAVTITRKLTSISNQNQNISPHVPLIIVGLAAGVPLGLRGAEAIILRLEHIAVAGPNGGVVVLGLALLDTRALDPPHPVLDAVELLVLLGLLAHHPPLNDELEDARAHGRQLRLRLVLIHNELEHVGHVHAPLQDQHDEAEDVPDEVDILVVDRRVGSCRQGAAVDAEQVDQNGQVGGVQFL